MIMTQAKANGYHSRSVQIISVNTKYFATVHQGPLRRYNHLRVRFILKVLSGLSLHV